MTAAVPLAVHEVDDSRWPDMVRLFEGRGGPRNCWCLLWREPFRVRRTLDLEGRRRLMEQRVQAGTPLGLLAYLEGEPVGWCSVAPRETYVELGGADYPADAVVWSLVCFYVRTAARRQGVAAALLRSAIETARAHGADVLEAYPVDPDSPSYRFMGFRPHFLAAGFEEVGRVGSRRYVVRLPLA